MSITKADLESRCHFEKVRGTVEREAHDAFSQPNQAKDTLRFLGRYVRWNGFFGSGVAFLSGKIGNSGLFRDFQEPVDALADRSMHVASFFFDAARDEFNDSDTPYRDTHRTLAQATLKGVIQHYGTSVDVANEMLQDPIWLTGLCNRTRTGYGRGTAEDLPSVFRSMGYHLGSEVLADQEFSMLDRILRKNYPELVDSLQSASIRLADEVHSAYTWISIHSGQGKAVEMDHFDWAVQGVDQAFRYTDPKLVPDAKYQLLRGFDSFVHDHEEFFALVNSAGMT